MTPERAYKHYDEQDLRFVFKNDFVDISMALQFDFSQDELVKIFQIICSTGTQKTDSKDQQDQVALPNRTTGSRFNL